MALTDCGIRLLDGTIPVDGKMHNLLPDGTVGDGPRYAFFEVVNLANGSLTSAKLYLTLDAAGGPFAVAVANGTAQAATLGWSPPDPSTLTYSSPTTQSAGLAVATLASGQKVLFCARRDLTSATTASPEVNRINLWAPSVPINF